MKAIVDPPITRRRSFWRFHLPIAVGLATFGFCAVLVAGGGLAAAALMAGGGGTMSAAVVSSPGRTFTERVLNIAHGFNPRTRANLATHQVVGGGESLRVTPGVRPVDKAPWAVFSTVESPSGPVVQCISVKSDMEPAEAFEAPMLTEQTRFRHRPVTRPGVFRRIEVAAVDAGLRREIVAGLQPAPTKPVLTFGIEAGL